MVGLNIKKYLGNIAKHCWGKKKVRERERERESERERERNGE